MFDEHWRNNCRSQDSAGKRTVKIQYFGRAEIPRNYSEVPILSDDGGSQKGRAEKYSAAATGRKTTEREKLSGRQKSAGEIPSRRGEIITIVAVIKLDFIGIIIISITCTAITTISTSSRCNIWVQSCKVHRGNFPGVDYSL